MISRINIFLSLVLLLFANGLLAQLDSINVNDNPYTVIYNHLYNLQTDTYNPERSSLSLPEGAPNKVDLAIKLKQILDGKGLNIDLNRVPKEANYFDSISKAQIYFIDRSEPLIYLEKLEDRWTYSRTTIESIVKLHKKIFPLGTNFISYFHAPVWQAKFLSHELWKWLGISILLFLFFLISGLLNRIFKAILNIVLRKKIEITEIVQKKLNQLALIFGFFLGIKFLLFFLPMFQLTSGFNASIIKGFNILNLFFIVLVLINISTIAFQYFEKMALKTESTLDDQLLPVARTLVSIIIWLFGFVYILDYLNVNVTALLAGLSIGGLALALAAQDTVKNFFGSVMIFLDRPFQIGEMIKFRDISGTVEEVGLRSTRVRTLENSLTHIPNSLLSDNVIDNMGLRMYRRFKFDIAVTYDTKPETIDQFVIGIREIINIHPLSRKDFIEVHLNSFGSSSLNILVCTFFQTQIWTEELKGRHEILFAIIKLAENLGVRFAFPTQTLHIEEIPGLKKNHSEIHKNEIESSKREGYSLDEIKKYFKIDEENKI